MRRFLCISAILAMTSATPVIAQTNAGLSSFRDTAELSDFLAKLQKRGDDSEAYEEGGPLLSPPPPPPAPPPPPMAAPVAQAADDVVIVTGASKASDDITNTQIAGVDEGGIVKMAGGNLVILRRGRLFTVSLKDGGMTPVDAINAYPPGTDASGDWYDEMLISGDLVIVVGYSYRRGGTEVNRFRLSKDGKLSFQDSTQLRSNDYYSSRNYASRLIGETLVYYTPLYLAYNGEDPFASLPAMRRWQPEGEKGAWEPIVTAQNVYIPSSVREDNDAVINTVHSVANCNLASERIDCKATAVLGSGSRTFFVSQNAVYVWTGALRYSPKADRSNAMLYRVPLDRDAVPMAVGVRGAPIDQFSFGIDEKKSALNVMVSSESYGDVMWWPEMPRGSLSLTHIPTSLFGKGDKEVPMTNYQTLPKMRGYGVQNRFVGNHLLYGTSGMDQVNVVDLADSTTFAVALPHKVGRLDAMGADAIVVGESKEGLGFSTVTLKSQPERADTFVLPASTEGETRSQAFFFRSDNADGSNGIAGLPVGRAIREGTKYLGNSSAIQYLARENSRLSDAGQLQAAGTDRDAVKDSCVASCTDWYGNARPVFWNGRVFALMGYELVEGREAGGKITETARTSFEPGAVKPEPKPEPVKVNPAPAP